MSVAKESRNLRWASPKFLTVYNVRGATEKSFYTRVMNGKVFLSLENFKYRSNEMFFYGQEVVFNESAHNREKKSEKQTRKSQTGSRLLFLFTSSLREIVFHFNDPSFRTFGNPTAKIIANILWSRKRAARERFFRFFFIFSTRRADYST